jgi:hypothetical protein
MGFAASQARFLTLTARLNDIEYQVQQICDTRIQLSTQLEQIANEYTSSIANTSLFTSSNSYSSTQSQYLTPENLAAQGYQVLVVATKQSYNDYTPVNGQTKPSIEDGLKDGTYVLIKQANPFSDANPSFAVTGLSGSYETVDWRTNANITEQMNTADDGAAEDKYNSKTQEIQSQDKKLTLQSNSLDTEHKSVEAELEAVKELIKKDSESSFKTFA